MDLGAAGRRLLQATPDRKHVREGEILIKLLERLEGKEKRNTPPPGAIAGLMDVGRIEGQAVRRKDGVFVSLVETEGEFFSLLSEEEQDGRIRAFARVLNGIPWPVQIVLAVEPTDLGAYLAAIEEAAARAGESTLAELAKAQAEMAEGLTRDVMAETVLLAVTGPNALDAANRAAQLEAQLSRAGFKAGVCSQGRLTQILHLAYGHKGRLSPPSPSWQTVLGQKTAKAERGGKGGRALISVAPQSPDVIGPNVATVDQLLMPSAVVERPGHIDLGGVFASTLVAVAYPERAGNGWLEPVLHFRHGSVRRRVSILVEPVPTDQAVGEISRKLVDLGVAERAALRRGRHADVDTELALEDAEALRQDLARGQQRMFDVTLTVTLMGDDLDELREAVSRLKQEAAGFLLMLRETYLEEQEGFRSTMPLQVQALKRVRPIPTVPLATTFPFTSGELLHDTGEMWGVNLVTGNAVIIDPRRYPAAHMLLVAATRSGKSMTFKHLATQALFTGEEDVMVIDPSPAIDYERWTKAVGGSYLRFGVGSDVRLNPCEIVLPAGLDPRSPERLDDDLKRPVTQKVAFLKALFELMAYPGERMPAIERARLEAPLYAMYEEAGMTDDWRSILGARTLAVRPVAKRSPTLKDALRHLRSVPELGDLALKVQPFVEGTLDMFSGATNAELGNKLTVFNVHQLVQTGGSHLQAVAYAMVMEAVRTRMAQSRRRKFVAIDEAHVLFANKDTARFLAALYRMAGKQGGRVAIMTQSITDLVGDPLTGVSVAGEEEARVCLGQTGISFFLRNDKRNDLELIARIFGLTEAEMRFLGGVQPGQGLVIAGNDRALVQVLPSDLLYRLATTRPEEVSAEEPEKGW